MISSAIGAPRPRGITDVRGIRVGHWSDYARGTGCTVVLMPRQGAVGGVDVRGSAPGTRETDLLKPGRLVERIHAVVLCGGSAFGLAAVDGVMQYLRERRIGLDVGVTRVPLVPAAVINDLRVGDPKAYPSGQAGMLACLDAEFSGHAQEGRVGAGTGATVGKMLGEEYRSPGGVGTAAITIHGGATVGAIAVVNPLGDVVDDRGEVLAGARDAHGRPIELVRSVLAGGLPESPMAGANTTLVVVATDARITQTQAQKLAELGQDGMALAIRPVHTLYDGDTVFAVGVGDVEADMTTLGIATTEVVRRAIQRGVSAVHGLA